MADVARILSVLVGWVERDIGGGHQWQWTGLLIGILEKITLLGQNGGCLLAKGLGVSLVTFTR